MTCAVVRRHRVNRRFWLRRCAPGPFSWSRMTTGRRRAIHADRGLLGAGRHDCRPQTLANYAQCGFVLGAFPVQQKEAGSVSLHARDVLPLTSISEFGAKPYTENEAKALSEIVKSFNERHGTQFAEADFIPLEQVKRKALDAEMAAVLRNNPRTYRGRPSSVGCLKRPPSSISRIAACKTSS